MILMIDNYDSFTYNLVQYFGEIGYELDTYRNDKISLEDIEKLKPLAIIISPGPGRPDDAGISKEAILKIGLTTPILGVCLGHQCIAEVYSGKIVRDNIPTHGKTSQVFHDGKTIYQGISNPFTATRYHSLIVEKESLPDCLEITARNEDQIIMGIRHKEYPVEGVQFHPESILTEEGKKILKNFIDYYIES